MSNLHVFCQMLQDYLVNEWVAIFVSFTIRTLSKRMRQWDFRAIQSLINHTLNLCLFVETKAFFAFTLIVYESVSNCCSLRKWAYWSLTLDVCCFSSVLRVSFWPVPSSTALTRTLAWEIQKCVTFSMVSLNLVLALASRPEMVTGTTAEFVVSYHISTFQCNLTARNQFEIFWFGIYKNIYPVPKKKQFYPAAKISLWKFK